MLNAIPTREQFDFGTADLVRVGAQHLYNFRGIIWVRFLNRGRGRQIHPELRFLGVPGSSAKKLSHDLRNLSLGGKQQSAPNWKFVFAVTALFSHSPSVGQMPDSMQILR